MQEYEELAVALGTDHQRRLALREQLKAVRLTCPLFDTRRWVAGAEKPSGLGDCPEIVSDAGGREQPCFDDHACCAHVA